VSKPLPAASRGDVSVKLMKTVDEAELAFQSAEAQTTVDREKAIAEYQRALKLKPKYFEAYIGLARAYSERGDIENAYKSLQSAKRIRPTDPEATVIEARILKDSGEEDKAIVTFKRAITQGRGFQPEANTGLGLLYKDRAENSGGAGDYEQEAGNYAEAAKYLAVAIKQLASAPDAVVVYQLLGLIYEKQKKYKEAIALYEDFLRLFPDVSEAAAVESFIVQIKKQMAEPK
jgi:tetratricopeptide (TPR) repeat protein